MKKFCRHNRSVRGLLTDAGSRAKWTTCGMSVQVVDVHTHVFRPNLALRAFGYRIYSLISLFDCRDVAHARSACWKTNKAERADLLELCLLTTLRSEATRGIVSILEALGLDPRASNLEGIRAFFRSRDPKEHLDWVLDTAHVSDVVMTNDPLNEHEAWIWKSGATPDQRFHATLRLDALVNEWEEAARKLAGQGCQ
jgi:hypothetical protein